MSDGKRGEARGAVRRIVLAPGAIDGRPSGAEVALTEEAAHHLRVLRLEPGTEIELTDGEGVVARAHLVGVDRRSARVALVEVARVPRPAAPELVLLQGVGKGDKLDQVVRQVAELGARRVVPVASARAVARRENRGERLRAIADDGLRVSGGAWRTLVEAPVELDAALAVEAEVRVALLVGATSSLRGALARKGPPPARVALLVGPEGGFDREEVDRILGAGFVPAHLGPLVLRTETAAPAAVAMAQQALHADPAPASGPPATFDHVSFGVGDLERAVGFYDAVLGPLGHVRLWRTPRAAGYGPPGFQGEAPLALVAHPGEARPPGPGAHFALAAPSREAVDRFHAQALAHGGLDEGPPGIRANYDPGYYAAFVRDPDGHRLEAVLHERL